VNPALKNVAVTAFAAQTLEGETWQGMCRWACDAAANEKDAVYMRNEMKAVEKQMKADYDVTTMPSAWRSAKSVVLAAVALNLALVKGAAVIGKTEVEQRHVDAAWSLIQGSARIIRPEKSQN